MKTIFALFTATILSVLLVQTSVSQIPVSTQASDENRRSVNYIGTRNEMLVFEVSFHFTDNQVKTLTIFDELGNEIHSERIKTNVFAKQYMFAKTTAGKLQFTLRGKKEIISEIFQISYKIEERPEITKA